MRSKLHLPVRPPHEAARRIARWVVTLPDGLDEAARMIDVPASYLQRMVEGAMMPGLSAGVRLHRHVGITARDFRQPAKGGWFDRVPTARAA